MLTFIYDPDEDEAVNDGGVFVPIVNDLINEATEQVFIVRLNLVDSLNPDSVLLVPTRRTSLCRIRDNDGKKTSVSERLWF